MRTLEGQRANKRWVLFDAQDEMESLIEEIESRMKQQIGTNELFTIKWKMVLTGILIKCLTLTK
ncbi:MAG: hypothetical protein AABY42_10990 [Nitrospirota bacterium]